MATNTNNIPQYYGPSFPNFLKLERLRLVFKYPAQDRLGPDTPVGILFFYTGMTWVNLLQQSLTVTRWIEGASAPS